MAALLLVVGVALGGGGTTAVEGGAYFDFVAPDPLGPTDGTIRFGFSGAVETIAADAVLVPPADTNLAFLGGGSPTCLAVTREGGVITRIEFVEDCTISGTVTRVDDLFGPGGDANLIADRVAAPADLVEGNPAFAALIGIPAAAGTTLELVFTLDMATGIPASFVGQSAVTGPVTILADGDIGVGAATLPDIVIDDTARAQLEDAGELGVDATVAIVGQGTIQQSGDPSLEITLTVTYTAPTPVPTPVPTVAPTPAQLPDTSAPPAVGALWAGAVVLWLAGVAAMVGIRTLGARRRRVE
jgi:hypothetical protein